MTGTADTWIAFAAFVVAVVSAYYAGVSITMARDEHVEFLKRLRARARLRVDLVPLQVNLAPDIDDDPLAIMAPQGQTFLQIFEIGVSNHGDGAAGPTVVNVLVPARVRGLEWSDRDGKAQATNRVEDSEEQLVTPDGTRLPTQWISRELRRVSTRTPQLVHFMLMVQATDVSIPLRIKAQCDELPDDVFEESKDFELKVHDQSPPYDLRHPTQP